jgi:hypothetical protein
MHLAWILLAFFLAGCCGHQISPRDAHQPPNEVQQSLRAHSEWLSTPAPSDYLYESLRKPVPSGDLDDSRRINFSSRTLRSLDLRGANLSLAILQHADLQFCDLRDAKFKRANLNGADLRHSWLQDAEFILVDVVGARFAGSDLTDARFELNADQKLEAVNWVVTGLSTIHITGLGPGKHILLQSARRRRVSSQFSRATTASRFTSPLR